jgi:hypothetical protein
MVDDLRYGPVGLVRVAMGADTVRAAAIKEQAPGSAIRDVARTMVDALLLIGPELRHVRDHLLTAKVTGMAGSVGALVEGYEKMLA